jgi:hypothetical protein
MQFTMTNLTQSQSARFILLKKQDFFLSVNPGAAKTAMFHKSKPEGAADFPITLATAYGGTHRLGGIERRLLS